MDIYKVTEINMLEQCSSNSQSADYICPVCSCRYANEKQFYGHLQVHSGEVTWKCFQCEDKNLEFESQAKLQMHENLCHQIVRPFKCDLCCLTFDRASQLDYHHRSIHLGEKSHVCQICSKGFFRKTDLRTHLNIHLGTNYCICEVCGKKFSHVSNLIRHCRMHAGVKPYPCSICGKRFTQISSLGRHKRIHDKESNNIDKNTQNLEADQTLQGEQSIENNNEVKGNSNRSDNHKIVKRQHYCKICGESFHFILLLRQHEKYHINSGKFQCKDCEKSFQELHDMKDHKCHRLGFDDIEIKTKKDKKDFIKSRLANNTNKEKIQDSKESKVLEQGNLMETVIYISSDQGEKTDPIDLEDQLLQDHLAEIAIKLRTADTIQNKDISINIAEILDSCNYDQNESLNNADIASYKNSDITDTDIIYVRQLDHNEFKLMPESNQSNSECAAINHEKEQSFKSDERYQSESLEFNSIVSDVCTSLSIEDQHEKLRTNNINSNRNLLSYESRKLVSYNHETNLIKSVNLDNIVENNRLVESIERNVNKLISNSENEFDDSSNANNGIFNCIEPTLRLVQTESGEQFYKLLINNFLDKAPITSNGKSLDKVHFEETTYTDYDGKSLSSSKQSATIDFIQRYDEYETSDNLENLTDLQNDLYYTHQEFQRQEKEFDSLQNNENDQLSCINLKNKEFSISISEKEMQNMQTFNLCHLDNDTQTDFENYVENNLEAFEKTAFENSEERFFELIEIGSTENNDTIKNPLCKQSPMLCVVQNEGEQLLELLQDSLQNNKYQNQQFVKSLNLNENKADFLRSPVCLPTSVHDNRSDLLIRISDNTEFQSVQYGNIDSKKPTKLETSVGKAIITEDINQSPAKKKSKKSFKRFQCKVCNKVFSSGYNYKQHIGTHFMDHQRFKCKDCGISFAWKSTLNKHIANNHRPDGPQKFVCDICPKVYTTLSQVNEHVKRDHLKQRNHVCPHCGKSFFKKFDLKTHSRTHTNERPYICRSCGKRFPHQSHIIRHERIHSGEKPYSCNVCQKTFAQPGSLKVHKQKHQQTKVDILDYQMDEDDPLAFAKL
ncbi:zinc finger protein 91-like [Prorops nasuta]|uniref:zinc finger protein 91-like n=1 Tax=Prorops nasuta TaxID=863751 RepID=UPI0034CEC345